MKVTADLVKRIPKGSSTTVKVDSPRDLNTARSITNYVRRFYPELGVRYSCSVNYSTNEVTITSIPVEKTKQSKK